MTVHRGIALFCALSVLGLVGVFFAGRETAALGVALARIRWPYLLLCLLGTPLADWLVSGLRLWLIARFAAPAVSYRTCVRTCAVGAFVNAATPSQTGGGAVQAYVLVRAGASVAESVSILLMTFLSSLVFYLCVTGAAAAAVACGWIALPSGPGPLYAAAAAFVLVTGVVGLVAVRPERALNLLEPRLRRLARGGRWRSHVERACRRLREGSHVLRAVTTRTGTRFAVAVALAVPIFGNRYVAAYLAARALGIDPPFLALVVQQVLLNVVLYFFPTPGGSGAAEAGQAAAMAPFVPGPLLLAHALIWRAATAYLSVLVGGLALAGTIRPASGRAGRAPRHPGPSGQQEQVAPSAPQVGARRDGPTKRAAAVGR
ncbi:MAG: lysylphosphatidylglycerol synthase transmembrane domain-containing protein [Candidatus Latescibacterota bacterium]